MIAAAMRMNRMSLVLLQAVFAGALAAPEAWAEKTLSSRELVETCTAKDIGRQKAAIAAACNAMLKAPSADARSRAIAIYHLSFLREGREGREAALAGFDEAMAADPSYVEPHIAKGLFLAFELKGPQAIAAVERALALDGNNARALSVRARAYHASGDHVRALADSTRAVALDPSNPSIRYFHGSLLEQSSRFEEAIPHMAFAARTYRPWGARRLPGIWQDEDPWSAYTRVIARAGRPLEAASILTTYLDSIGTRDRDAFLYDIRADYYVMGGEFEKAAADFGEAAARSRPGRQVDYQIKRAMMLLKAEKFAEAKDALYFFLRSGNLNAVLRMQVKLRNAGFSEVEITGRMDETMERALEACLTRKECSATLSRKS